MHAPLFAFMGHLEPSGQEVQLRRRQASTAAPGIAEACGAEVVVFHPGFLLGRSREDAIAAVVDQLGMLRERLEGKGRAVPFGVEVMGRVRDLGSLDDVIEISARTGWVRPVPDFAHMHATSDGAYLEASLFAEALEAADAVLAPGAPFHIHFSDIAYANRNEKHHLPYGEGTLRAEPLREALDALRAAGDGDLASRPTRRRARRSGRSSGLLDHRVPDPLGDLGEQLRDPREAPVELAPGGHLAQVVELEQLAPSPCGRRARGCARS